MTVQGPDHGSVTAIKREENSVFGNVLKTNAHDMLVALTKYEARTGNTFDAIKQAAAYLEKNKDPALLALARQFVTMLPERAKQTEAQHILGEALKKDMRS